MPIFFYAYGPVWELSSALLQNRSSPNNPDFDLITKAVIVESENGRRNWETSFSRFWEAGY